MFVALRKLAKVIYNKKGVSITSIRSHHGGEIQNKEFEKFYNILVFDTPFPIHELPNNIG